jgi:hypothetical protein
MCIDNITRPRDAKQFTDPSGGGIIQCSDLGTPEDPLQVRLTRHATPHLSNDTTTGDHRCTTQLVTGNQRPDIPVLALNSHERARVENQGHSAGQPGCACWRLLFSLIEDPISLRKLLRGQGALFGLPRGKRFSKALIPEAGFDCLGNPAGDADAALLLNQLRHSQHLAAGSDGSTRVRRRPLGPGRA